MRNQSECETPLTQGQIRSMYDHVTGGAVFVTRLSGMTSMMSHVGVEKEKIDNLIVLVQDEHPVLKHTVAALTASENARDLLICVMDSECDFTSQASNAAALHVSPAQHTNFRVVNFSRAEIAKKTDMEILLQLVQEEDARDGSESRLDPSDGSQIYVRAHKKQTAESSSDPLAAYSDLEDRFLHEATHYADKIFLREWVAANVKLRDAGQKTDRLFLRFARQVGPLLFVSEEFDKFFTETRAYSVSAHVISRKFPDLNSEGIRSLMGATVMLDSVINRGQEVLEFFGLPTDPVQVLGNHEMGRKILAFGDGPERLELEMMATILRARALK
jgi:hypothetical protein